MNPKDYAIRTFTGNYVNLLKPSLEDVELVDIAHHLAMECRWGGATKRHYSVAEHSLWVARFIAHLVPARYVNLAQLHATVHDGHEYIFKDVPTPLKKLLGQAYTDMCYKLDLVIWRRVHVAPPNEQMREAIKMADSYAAWCEAEVLVARCKKFKAMGAVKPPDELRKKVAMEPAISWEAPTNIEQQWLSTVNFLMGQVL